MEYCCENCFSDDYLKKYIQANGTIGNCSFCNSKNVKSILPTELAPLFEPVVYLYSPIEDFMPLEELKEWEGDFIWDKLQEDWEIFDFDKLEYGKHEKIMYAIFPVDDPKEGTPSFLTSHVEREDEYWGTEDELSERLERLWDDFCHELKFENRFFPKKEFDHELLTELISSLSHGLRANSDFFRARKSDKGKKFHCTEMAKPSPENSKGGRANPKGIPYLYLVSDVRTAISEIRPTIREHVTVGEFFSKKSLTVIDLRDPKIDSPFRHGDNLQSVLNSLSFLRKLGIELSRTVHEKVAELEYIPLQYLCELIKSRGYAGIIYKSSMGEGYNLVIFDGQEFECLSTELYEVEKIIFDSKKIS
jgi:hypothetical protein